MFGYVVINKPEIKFKDYEVYQSFYCGLCKVLKEKYGIAGQMTLTYDMTFLTILLTGLYEPRISESMERCLVHPVRKHHFRISSVTDYAADMNLLMTYYKCMDDWADERKLLKYLYGKMLLPKDGKWVGQYKAKIRKIVTLLRTLSRHEADQDMDIDRMSGYFGKLMEELFVFRQDMWEPALRKMGFYLGKFIYLMDAYEDVEKDKKDGNYNPFSKRYGQDTFARDIQEILTLMMAECCREFEKLPIVEYADILRNILYSGVWCRFAQITVKRQKEETKKNVPVHREKGKN